MARKKQPAHATTTATPKASENPAQKLWTPEPEPYNEALYVAWGQKHYGEDWHELRELMLRERNFLKPNLQDDHVYLERQKALRKMEQERAEGKQLLDRGKSWPELQDWARLHYGMAWSAEREAIQREEKEAQEAEGAREKYKKESRLRKRRERMIEIEDAIDGGLLEEGKTWQELMAWTSRSSPPAVHKELVDVPPSPASSSDNSNISTYPPSPSVFSLKAREGPPPILPSGQPNYDHDWENTMESINWPRIEWAAIKYFSSQEQYEASKSANIRFHQGKQKSLRENWICEQRGKAEERAIGRLERVETSEEEIAATRVMQRRRRDLDLRQQGWTQSDIDAMQHELDVRTNNVHKAAMMVDRDALERLQHGPPPLVPLKPKSQEHMNMIFYAWDVAGLSRQRQNELARSYGFGERLSALLPETAHGAPQEKPGSLGPSDSPAYGARQITAPDQPISSDEHAAAMAVEPATSDADGDEKTATKDPLKRTLGGRITKRPTKSTSTPASTSKAAAPRRGQRKNARTSPPVESAAPATPGTGRRGRGKTTASTSSPDVRRSSRVARAVEAATPDSKTGKDQQSPIEPAKSKAAKTTKTAKAPTPKKMTAAKAPSSKPQGVVKRRPGRPKKT